MESAFKIRPIGRAEDDIFVMMSSFYLHHQSISGQRRPPQGNVMLSIPSSCWFYHFGSPQEIEGHLPEHRVYGILDQPREPGPKGIVVEMRDTKILLNDVSLLRYLFVLLFLVVRQFCRGRIFSHNTVYDLVHIEKISVRFSKTPFIGVHFFLDLNSFFFYHVRIHDM